jgi:hypothetical protein
MQLAHLRPQRLERRAGGHIFFAGMVASIVFAQRCNDSIYITLISLVSTECQIQHLTIDTIHFFPLDLRVLWPQRVCLGIHSRFYGLNADTNILANSPQAADQRQIVSHSWLTFGSSDLICMARAACLSRHHLVQDSFARNRHRHHRLWHYRYQCCPHLAQPPPSFQPASDHLGGSQCLQWGYGPKWRPSHLGHLWPF